MKGAARQKVRAFGWGIVRAIGEARNWIIRVGALPRFN